MFNWATSDQHFGHPGIMKYCDRPFSDVADMTFKLVEMFNCLVSPEDRTLHIGDFALCIPYEKQSEILRSLNGHHTLVKGNHDGSATKMREIGFDAVYDQLIWTQGGKRYYAVHDPQDASGKLLEGGVMLLHGHCHGKCGRCKRAPQLCIDVGVDPQNYLPVRLDG